MVGASQVAVLSARLEGKEMELESYKEDHAEMMQKVSGASPNGSGMLLIYSSM